jgi:glucose/arabinose dehydrogenase
MCFGALSIAPGPVPQVLAAVAVPDGFVNETVVTGLSQPIGMAFLPDGRILVAEQRTGNIRVVVPSAAPASEFVFTVPDLNIVTGERGLLGLAVDPNWPVEPFVYLMYTRTGNRIRIVRYHVAGDIDDPTSGALLFLEPLRLLDELPDNSGDHNGGRLRFGPDGFLYASVGDDQDFCAAADSTSMKGQLMRLDVSGLYGIVGSGQTVDPQLLVPPTNPFPAAPLTWAYGMRNPWNFQIDPELGTVLLADVGESFNDEIDEVLAGDFLGWPWREGNRVIVRQTCPEPGFEGANFFKGPAINVPHPAQTFAVYMGLMYRPQPGGAANWPAEYSGFYGSLFYGEYYTGWLRRAKKQSGIWAPAAAVPGQPNGTDWGTGFKTAVDFMMDHDGSVLWMAQFNENFQPQSGMISRIRSLPVVDVPRPDFQHGLMRAMPNPFQGRTEIAFALPAAENVRLDIYDISGRRVRRLFDGVAGAGAHHHAWDGRDGAGAALPAGVYLARLERPEGGETLRLMRLK